MSNNIKIQTWKVGIISTDYDLNPIRRNVTRLVSDLGFEPIAFELPSMPKEPGVHSHKACILAIEVSDIIILVIDKRYGGLYLGKGPYSVTEEEFRRAYRLKKIIIPCVSKEAFDDRWSSYNAVEKLMRNKNISQEEARKIISPSYVDKWDVLDFIERVRKMDRDQYLEIYISEDDLVKRIQERLRNLSRYVCSLIIEEQLHWIDSLRSTSGMFETIGVLGNRFFIDPPFKIVSGNTKKRKALSLLDSLQDHNTSILVTGDPGVGKTVLLAHAFKRHANSAIRNKSYRLPFFLSLRGIGAKYHFKITEHISECCETFLKKEKYPALTLKDIVPVFYIDGFDEGTEIPPYEEIKLLANSEIIRSPCVLCARSEYAKGTIDTSYEFGSTMHHHIEILPWSRQQSLLFVDHYCTSTGNLGLSTLINELLRNAPANHPVLKSPLLLALIIWLAIVDPSIPFHELSLDTVFSWFIEKWAIREIGRYDKRDTKNTRFTHKDLIECWKMAAWTIYQDRHLNIYLKPSDLKKNVSVLTNISEMLIHDLSFESLLTFSAQHSRITGMIHEQFLEYLLAQAFTEGCTKKNPPFPEYLSYQINFEVNLFIKSIWATKSKEELFWTLKNIKESFESNMSQEEQEAVNKRVNSIYYISRIPLELDAKKTLEEALQQPTDLYTKNGILFALVRLGDRKREKELYKSFTENKEADAINRGLHLVYFKDWFPKNERPPYIDNGRLEWHRTCAGMMNHVLSMEIRFINSKRLDIYIIRSFLQSRKQLGSFKAEYLHQIQSVVLDIGNQGIVDRHFYDDIKYEFSLLESLVKEISC